MGLQHQQATIIDLPYPLFSAGDGPNPAETHQLSGACLRDVFVVVTQQLFRVVVGVGAGLTVVEVWRWDPLGDAVCARARGPALLSELVVRAAGQSEVVDVGFAALGPRCDVVDFGQVARHIAVGK